MSLNERRKAMNRDAALRYRERKKCELDELKREAVSFEINKLVEQFKCSFNIISLIAVPLGG